MAKKNILAGDVQVGMVMASTIENEVFSVKKVIKKTNPALQRAEISIYGPLGILIKKDFNQSVTILV